MQLPNGLFYELEDLPAEVQERAMGGQYENHSRHDAPASARCANNRPDVDDSLP